MMTSQILKFVDSWKTQKSKYLENKILFFLKQKIYPLDIKDYIMAKNNLLVEVSFNISS